MFNHIMPVSAASLLRPAVALIPLLAVVFGLVAVSSSRAQGQVDRDHVPGDERVDPLDRRKSDIDGNSVRATIFNFGQTGRTGGGIPDEIPYEWPKNTRQHYIALTGIFVGAEVEAEDGEPIWIVDVPNYRTDPSSDESWTFEPIGGYASAETESIARSDDPSTWPECWPDKQDAPADPGWCGSWNGYFGKDVFNADQELFYRMGDDRYQRYINDRATHKYYPDSTDLTRGGLGLVVDSRVLAWSQILIDDVVFMLHAVKNDGSKDLAKVGVTLWLADLVGGDGDTDDDQPFYDLLEDVAWMTDQDGRGNQFYGSDPVGVAAASFLETPGNAVDRIDNDGDGTTGAIAEAVNEFGHTAGEPGSPVVTADMLEGECPSPEVEGTLPPTCYDGIDNNGNGLVDENRTHIPFNSQAGVGYADYIDNDGDGEQDGPTVTQNMIDVAASDQWQHWPPVADRLDGEAVHLIGVGSEDLGRGFKDGVDNDGSCVQPTASYPYESEPGSPTVTQAMVDAAASDAPYYRYRVPGAGIVLYDLGADDLGKCYADGLDNDEDGAVDEGIDEGIDEMIDESRADGLDNDGDWRASLDDVGLDGAAFSGDAGESDGQPSTGAGTEQPGEPNVDVTDVSESDQIGITNVQYDKAGGINYQTVSDKTLFRKFMAPGSFYDPSVSITGDYDLFVSSGVFPLKAGQTERFSLAVMLGEDQADVLRKRNYAMEAYAADYKFAQAPKTPTVEAVPGDGKVTLYWDTAAESSFDAFIADLDLGLDPYDFEGYRVYRSTDPSFLDAKVITDGFGNSQFLKPIAQFDRADGRKGFHPVDVNGVKFHIGNDSGIENVFVDDDVTNGVTYYYAVTAYDFGAVFPADAGRGGASELISGIPPSETPIRIRFLADGEIDTGPNVVEVTPSERVAGYEEAGLSTVDGYLPRTAGNTTSRVGYEVIDPRLIEDGHTYQITFQDTLRPGRSGQPDTLTTRNFTLTDVTDDEVLIDRSTAFREGVDAAVVEGFRLKFFLDPFIVVDQERSGWNDTTNHAVGLQPFSSQGLPRGIRNPADYRIEVVGPEEASSSEITLSGRTFPARPTNVRIVRTSGGGDEEVPYLFINRVGEGSIIGSDPVLFEADSLDKDFIVLYEPLPDGTSGITWQVSLDYRAATTNPSAGDVATIVTKKPFLSSDVFEFEAHTSSVDEAAATVALSDVVVVPNPYRAASAYEQDSPFRYGRNRHIQFKNLPVPCTIRIFTASGHLVETIEHPQGGEVGVSEMLDGTASWDLTSKDGLAVSYGLYLYHIDAPEVGERTGTFAIIK